MPFLGSVDPAVDDRGYQRPLHGHRPYNSLSRLSTAGQMANATLRSGNDL